MVKGLRRAGGPIVPRTGGPASEQIASCFSESAWMRLIGRRISCDRVPTLRISGLGIE
jgi:hypothetical protein